MLFLAIFVMPSFALIVWHLH